MERAIVVRGRLTGARHIELDEPLAEIDGPVEVVVRSLSAGGADGQEDVFDYILSLSPGARSKEDIDRQVREERDAWENR